MDGATMNEKDLLLSGGFGRSSNSARAGFLPVALERIPLGALHGIPVHVRTRPDPAPNGALPPPDAWFRLYCAPDVRFGEVHRRRLLDNDTKFLYIKMADQSRFRQQVEELLQEAATDPAIALSERSALIYETSVELVNELLGEPDLIAKSPRLEQVSRAITTLVMNNPHAFPHLFAASHHDFYTATHMVNVATWMVPLSFEMGIHDPDELNHICQAGMLHDMGKVEIPEAILNKPGKLSDDEWAQIKRHPIAGCEYLEHYGNVHPLVLTVTRQHHERMDGTGYPDGLKGDEIKLVSRICAVVDSFDAMTAFRPFKTKTLTVEKTLEILQSETPAKYDPAVMTAWLRLIKTAEAAGALGNPAAAGPAPAGTAPSPASKAEANAEEEGQNRRLHERRTFHCPARLHALESREATIVERPAMPVVAHSISRGGLGLLSQSSLIPGDHVRVYLSTKGWETRGLDGVIVRCRTHTDMWHEIGLQFTTVEADYLPKAA